MTNEQYVKETVDKLKERIKGTVWYEQYPFENSNYSIACPRIYRDSYIVYIKLAEFNFSYSIALMSDEIEHNKTYSRHGTDELVNKIIASVKSEIATKIFK